MQDAGAEPSAAVSRIERDDIVAAQRDYGGAPAEFTWGISAVLIWIK